MPAELIPSLDTVIVSAFARTEEHVAVGSFDVTLLALDLQRSGAVTFE